MSAARPVRRCTGSVAWAIFSCCLYKLIAVNLTVCKQFATRVKPYHWVFFMQLLHTVVVLHEKWSNWFLFVKGNWDELKISKAKKCEQNTFYTIHGMDPVAITVMLNRVWHATWSRGCQNLFCNTRRSVVHCEMLKQDALCPTVTSKHHATRHRGRLPSI